MGRSKQEIRHLISRRTGRETFRGTYSRNFDYYKYSKYFFVVTLTDIIVIIVSIVIIVIIVIVVAVISLLSSGVGCSRPERS